jgi:CheY-like chemotaxis protein
MSVADDATMRRAIARTLTVAVRATLSPEAPPKAYEAARDAAQVLGLAGLDRAIRACSEHAGRTRPADVVALIDRLRRLTEESDASGDLSVFERLDAELVALAEELAAYEWDVPAGPDDDETAAVPTMTVAQVLEDVTLVGDDSRRMASRLRLTATVAATLRASLDWLMPTAIDARSVRIHGEPSLVELRLDAVNPSGLGPAHRVLSAVGGNLGPAIEPEGPEGGWIIRVPSFAARPTYLMVMQGGIRLALPWHSVLRLRMAGAADARGDMRGLDYPTLEFFATPASPASEYPLVLVGHGLKRAWLVADRLIWRLMADPCESPALPPAPGLAETVRTDEDEVYWRAEPGRLLRRVDVPAAPPRRGVTQDPPAETPPPSSLGEDHVQPAHTPSSAEEPVVEARPVPQATPAEGGAALESPTPTVAMSPTLTVAESPSPTTSESPTSAVAVSPTLTAAESPASTVAPPPSLSPTVASPLSPAAAPATPSSSRPTSSPASRVERRPRALVAEDSLTARIFLSRLLDQQGFVTESVPSAAQLLERLVEGPWSVVMVDVDLPDDRGAAWLEHVRQVASGSAVVALVRDAAEGDSARQAGVSETLEKPFDRTSLVALLARLGFAKTGS